MPGALLIKSSNVTFLLRDKLYGILISSIGLREPMKEKK